MEEIKKIGQMIANWPGWAKVATATATAIVIALSIVFSGCTSTRTYFKGYGEIESETIGKDYKHNIPTKEDGN